jgi:hypothetical protein
VKTFTESQIQDLIELQRASEELGAEVVIIGAMAYRAFIRDTDRIFSDLVFDAALPDRDCRCVPAWLTSASHSHRSRHLARQVVRGQAELRRTDR